MIIDILKDSELWDRLEFANEKILEISKTFKFYDGGKPDESREDKISAWFDPARIKWMPTAKCYPETDSRQLRAEYNLVLFPANYLTLFLLDRLYGYRTDVCVQDVGSGVGHFIIYASLLGFRNFHLVENFSQITEDSLRTMMEAFQIQYCLNEPTLKPTVINNVAVFIESEDTHLVSNFENLELVCINTNPKAEKWLEEKLTKQGFVFLCTDKDNFQIAYCRKDKYEEFRQSLSEYQYRYTEPVKIPQYEPVIGRLEKKAVNSYMEDPGFLTEYKKTEQFENRISEYLGVENTIVVNNGTISLSLALLAVGIEPGDKVIVPNLTMIATMNAVRLIGAEPILVDVDNRLLLNLHKAKDLIEGDPKIRAVIFVSLNGKSLQLEDLWFIEFCRHRHLGFQEPYVRQVRLIEDAAQSFGSRLWDSAFIGSLSLFDITSFSFSMPKIITTGQGGCLVTNNKDTANRVRRLKDFGRGSGGNDIHDTFGINSKFTEMQAVIGIEQLKDIDFRTSRKKEIFKLYREQLSSVKQVGFVPTDLHYTVPWFVDIFVPDPKELAAYLKEKGIGTRLIYPPLNTQRANESRFNSSSLFPISKEVCSRGLWLPSSFTLTDNQIDRVCTIIKEYYG